MKDLWAVCAIALVFVFGPSLASESLQDAEAKEVFGTFEVICLELLRSQEKIPNLLENMGAKELPSNQAASFLMPHKGRAWIIRHTDEVIDPFVIAVSDTTSCSVIAPRANGAFIFALFQKYTRNAKIDEQKIGSQIEHVFAVSHDDQFHEGDVHAVVLITMSQLFNGEGIVINAVPEVELAKEGIRTPPWPE